MSLVIKTFFNFFILPYTKIPKIYEEEEENYLFCFTQVWLTLERLTKVKDVKKKFIYLAKCHEKIDKTWNRTWDISSLLSVSE